MASRYDDEQSAQAPQESETGSPSAGYLAPEVSRRVSSILDAVEHEAADLRRQAREEAHRYFEYSKRRADGLVAERQRHISALSHALVTRAERVLSQLEGAEPVRAAFDDLVRALGETAERLARESGDLGEFEPPAFSETPAVLPPTPATQASKPPSPPSQAAPPSTRPKPRSFAGESRPPRVAEPPAPGPGQPAVSTPPPAGSPPRPTPAGQGRPAGGSGLVDQHWQNLNGAQMVAVQMAAAGSTRGQVEAHVRKALEVAEPGPILDKVFGPGSRENARVPWARSSPE